jgi:hypothetical protein
MSAGREGGWRGDGQGVGRTEAAGRACRDRRGVGRREEPAWRRKETNGLGGRGSEHSAYIGGGQFACVGDGLNAFAAG